MRTAFIQQLITEARQHSDIFLLVGDLGYSVVEPFSAEFPDRFLNMGIAEQNMAGVAAGLAREGYNVFIYSIGNFPTLRCMEQIRYDVCYHQLSVKVVAVGGGYAYGPLGVSHHTTEDIGMLRTLPDLIVAAPGDPAETRLVTAHFSRTRLPGYLRLGKAGEPVVHDAEPGPETFGTIYTITSRDANHTAVLSTGGILAYAAQQIKQKKLPYNLFSCPVIKPIDEAGLLSILARHERLITIEEHQRSGGFGSAVLEAANDLLNRGLVPAMPRIEVMAIPDRYIGFSGTQDYLRETAGLTF